MSDRLLRRRRPLIPSLLERQITATLAPRPSVQVLAERGGMLSILRVPFSSWTRVNKIRFISLAAGNGSRELKRKALKLGDYSLGGLEDVCAVERKDLSDLVHSCTVDRRGFIDRLRTMARFQHRLLVITSS